MKRNRLKDEYYYYLRDKNNYPIITICLKKKNNNIARGLSILNSSDRIDKKEGRKWARRYADKALGRRKTDLPIRRKEVLEKLNEVYEYNNTLPIIATENKMICEYKSVFEPVLTNYEYKLLTKEDKNELS